MLPCGDPGERVPALFVVAKRTDEKKAYELLDGNVISAGRKHFRCQKSRSNGDQRNPRHVSLNILKCDVDIRKDLYASSFTRSRASFGPHGQSHMEI